MPEPFKTFIDAAAVRGLADPIRAVWPAFDHVGFVAAATDGLEPLELKARVAHVAAALRPRLPEAWPEALRILVDSLPPPLPDASEVTSGFRLWPLLHLVETCGLEHPETSLDALPALTKRFSAEFAIRPYLLQHPEHSWPRLHRWVEDPDLHVRRLCSEGTRPRLPWGMRLTDAVADPSRGLELLDRLVDDPEPYVRRSVANHLNDVSKDHPERAVQVARAWLADPTPEREQVVRRALRTRIKAGDPEALAALGYGPARADVLDLSVAPDPVSIGASTRMRAELAAGAGGRWLIDWVVRSPRADGTLSRRVVKGGERTVRAGDRVTVSKALSLKPVTTRVTRPGTWSVGLQLNGELVGEVPLVVTGEAR